VVIAAAPSPRGAGARRLAGLPAIVLAAAACSALYPVRIERLGALAGEPRDAAHVEVLPAVPQREFVEIARLATESANYDSPGHAVERLRTVAGELGADAIVVHDRGIRAASASIAAPVTARDFGFRPEPVAGGGGAPIASFAWATAIRWTGPDPGDVPRERRDPAPRK
jgi:hypothetical protein